MNKIFIDTNILVYLLIKDQPKKQKECKKLLEIIEVGKIKPYSSDIVFMELVYVLVKHYKQSQKTIAKTLLKLSEIRNLTLIEKTDVKKALLAFEKHSIKFGDCLISTQIPPDSTLITFDKDFKKFPNVISMTPEEFLEMYNIVEDKKNRGILVLHEK